MDFAKVIENVSTLVELKRIASPYVIDYRGLDEVEIKAALIKTAPQYYYKSNVEKAVHALTHGADHAVRIVAPYMLKRVLLQRDNHMSCKRETEDAVIKWEQTIVDRSNEDLLKKSNERRQDLEFFHYVLEAAWENNADISVDEFNLLEKIRRRLKITNTEYRIIEAKLGNFPAPGNVIHTRSNIEDIRRVLQSSGLLFSIRDEDGTDFDVIPDEIAATLRIVLGIEIRDYGYSQMLKYKAVRSKPYLLEVLQKCGIKTERNPTMEELFAIFIEQVGPRMLLGGMSPRDGIAAEDLSAWCGEIGLNVSGAKSELIERLIGFYDALSERSETVQDERELLLPYFEDLAHRRIGVLRSQQLIEKDIEIERKFEAVTDYIFEKMLGHKPLALIGSNHADGALSFRDKVIYWDNKSKESAIHLKDHLRQFDTYIRSSEKAVAGFVVIGPDFTAESSVLAMQYQVENGILITLITATELKELALRWKSAQKAETQDAFQLGYLLQPGRFNPNLIPA